MAGNGRFTTRLFNGDIFVGNMVIMPQTDTVPFPFGEELRVSSLSPPSERCVPLVVLQTIASDGVLFKTEPAEQQLSSNSRDLEELHSLCLKESKTAVVILEGGNELHLVAMNSTRVQWPCFWGFLVTSGLYNSCLAMLNLRCLAMVFDLDETLIVANTMRSFEDRIDALDRKIRGEVDSQRVMGMSAELKRYQEDRMMLKQFVEHDHVWNAATEKFISAHIEYVPPSSEGGPPLNRPVIRLQERNVIFTRINPNVRDTSVLVRLRPAWEELRSYLTARGRKRFDVYICTMSEKDYAMEMWRLLDPEGQLIKASDVLERVVCVKSGSKKSLENVFHLGRCHPKVAMVIDDRLKVWEERDQSHVHVVPAFAPYYAPQAETNCPLPILCVARNVACNVRGAFFKDFDESFSKKIGEVAFDTDVSTLPQPPDVRNYLMSEEESAAPMEIAEGLKDISDSTTDAEGEGKLKPQGLTSIDHSGDINLGTDDSNLGLQPPSQVQPTVFPLIVIQPHLSFSEAKLDEKKDFSQFQKDSSLPRLLRGAPPSQSFEPPIHSSPVREEGEVPESELDPDTRRRLLILQHGQDTGHSHNAHENSVDTPFPGKAPLQLTIPSVALPGGWLGAEEEISPRQLSRSSSGLLLEPESPSFCKKHSHGSPFFPGSEFVGGDISYCDARRHSADEPYVGEERPRCDSIFVNHTYPGFSSLIDDDPFSRNISCNSRELQLQSERANPQMSNPVCVLQEIAQKCNTKVDFKSLVTTTRELQFSVEVLFGGERVGEGTGRTKKEAQHRAAEDALRFMAGQFISQPSRPLPGLAHGHPGRFHGDEDSGQHWNARDPRFAAGLGPVIMEDNMPVPGASGQLNFLESMPAEEPQRPYNAVVALKDWCTMESMNVVFKEPPPGTVQDREVQAQVEVAGRIMGKGCGVNWEMAKQQAADEALRQLKSTQHARFFQKRVNPPRSPSHQPAKRFRAGDAVRGMQRLLTSPRRLSPRRYPKNGSSVS